MSSKKHHAEWLSLIEVSGPFLSMPVLERVFRQGLDAHDPEHIGHLRLAFDEWEENQSGRRPNPAIHKAWIDYVLKQTLGLPDEVLVEGQAVPQTIKATVAEQGETLRPDAVVKNPEGVPNAGNARLLIQTYPGEQDLEKAVIGKHWKASPATRMMELLHSTDVRLGLVTNGDRWMLVDAPKGDTTGFSSWYASLWFEESVTLRAFRSLLGVSRFFSVADDDTLEAMLKESAEHQHEVTDQLGLQVRRAVEVLIQSLDRADRDDKILGGVPESVLYEAALTVMMRLVFLFSAEERGLLLLGDPLYDQHYAVSTLVAQLQEAADQHGEEVLERRLDGWVRLLSTFRAVYGGVRHERMKLIPYAGNLFNPDRFPFLEGRKPGTTWRTTPATPLPVNNRTVLHVLRSLQYLQLQGEARRLSFRALDIEQIGHVYEGLLDHTAKRAPEPMLGLAGAKGVEPEVSLAELERLRAKGETDLLAYLADETGKQEKTLKKALTTTLDAEGANKLRAVCGNEDALFQRVRTFSGLLRNDTFDRPVVIRKGSVFVTAGTDRRSSGTHYTPRSLTEPIVQYTLEPLVYVGPAEGTPKEEWKLRPAKELLDLKICDMACGSGAFLVQACRYMSERLLEAWENEERAEPGRPRTAPEGKRSEGERTEKILEGVEDREIDARRLIAQQCLYGVDKNPLAVEMAKLSLWLLTLAKDKPFEFLDHAIRCGDSLVGLSNVEQLRSYSLQPDEPNTIKFSGPLDSAVDEAIGLRLKLEGLPSNTVEDVERQEQLLKDANDKIARLRYAADLLVAGEFWGENPKDKAERVRHNAVRSGHYLETGPTEEFERSSAKERRGQLMFHWPLEFPEVLIKRGGFDAFVGNPPFLGGKRISTEHGDNYERFLKIAFDRSKGAADLCCYFFRRAFSLLGRTHSFAGLLGTSSIVEGDSREVSLGAILNDGGQIFSARPSFAWPGQAGVFAAEIHFSRTPTLLVNTLDGHPVEQITTHLDTYQTQSPHQLSLNRIKYTQGQTLNGEGFLIDSPVRDALLKANPKNEEVIAPYVNGDIFNSTGDLTPRRWAITFGTRERDEAAQFKEPFRLVTELVKPHRDKLTRQVHESRYWLYWDKREAFLRSIATRDRILVCPIVTKYLSFRFFSITWVFSHKLKLFDVQDFGLFGVLQSAIHEVWARQFSSTLGQTMNYSTSDAFDTFCFPVSTDVVIPSARSFYEGREAILTGDKCGLTDLCNRFHDPDEIGAKIRDLQRLQLEMDRAVAAAYGWTDLDLGHGLHKTKQGIRFTISEPARREVLQRLLSSTTSATPRRSNRAFTRRRSAGSRRAVEAGKQRPPPSEPRCLATMTSPTVPKKTQARKRRPPEEPERSDRHLGLTGTTMPSHRVARRPSTNSTPTTSWRRSVRRPEAGAGSSGTN